MSMSDAEGNYLFSTDGRQIISWDGTQLQGGDSLAGTRFWYRFVDSLQQTSNTFCSGRVVCLPMPGNPQRYLLLEQEIGAMYYPLYFVHGYFNLGLLYHVIDMSANGGHGAVVQKNQGLYSPPGDTLEPGGLCATRHANGRDWWILQHGRQNNCYYRYLLDPSGIHYLGKQCTGQLLASFQSAGGLQPCFSPSGEYYFRPGGLNNDVSLFEFDRCTGLLGNELHWYPRLVQPPSWNYPVGCAFSASGKRLYVAMYRELNQYSMEPGQFDLPSLLASEVKVDSFSTFGTGQYMHPLYGPMYHWTNMFRMYLAPDGRIYFEPNFFSGNLIQYPEEQGAAVGYTWDGMYLPTGAGGGAPNHPHYRLGALTGSGCDTLGLSSLQSTSYWLDFGQVEAGSSATLGIDVVSRVGYPASLDTLLYRQATGVFSSSLALPTMLPKYDTLHYDVTFSPTSAGYVEDTLELYSNYGLVRVRLTGNGINSVGTVASQPVSVQLYPNPANNAVTVYAQGAEIAQALLYSSRGELLKTQSIAQSKGQLDLTGLPPGLYLVELVLADGRRGISKLLVINY
jgi:hypothetical protein